MWLEVFVYALIIAYCSIATLAHILLIYALLPWRRRPGEYGDRIEDGAPLRSGR